MLKFLEDESPHSTLWNALGNPFAVNVQFSWDKPFYDVILLSKSLSKDLAHRQQQFVRQ